MCSSFKGLLTTMDLIKLSRPGSVCVWIYAIEPSTPVCTQIYILFSEGSVFLAASLETVFRWVENDR